MEPFSVIAFDPGGTTGIATAQYTGDPEVPVDPKFDFHIKTFELGPDEHHSLLFHALTTWSHTAVGRRYIITESFEFRQSKKKDKLELISKEYIGIMKLFAQITEVTYFERNASAAKNFVDDKKLTAHGILEVPKHPMRHRNDALRHLIMFLVVNLRIQSPITNQWRD